MSASLNQVNLIGNLGANPETRFTQSGAAVCNFRIATSENWKDKQTGEMQESTEWHRIVAFGRTAEICRDFLGKGSSVYVNGRLQTRKWQDQGGVDHYSTEIICQNMQMLGGKSGNIEAGETHPSGGQYTQQQRKPAAPEEDFDDDIPF